MMRQATSCQPPYLAAPAPALRERGTRRRPPWLVGLTLVAALGQLPGCASKTYVRRQLAPEVGQRERLAALEASLEESAERIDALEAKTAENQEVLEQASASARLAGERAAEIERLATAPPTVLLRYTPITFEPGRASLDFAARELLDAFAAQLLARGQPVHVEIRGHTDSGEASALGEARAESVERYLHLEHGVPLHRMDTVSLGSRRAGDAEAGGTPRQHNRLVSLLVLE